MKKKKVTIRERIAQSQLYIEEHLDEDIPLEYLAEQCGYSQFHFHSIFKGIVGEGVKEYQRRLIMQRAAQQLLFSTSPLIDVALDAGYGSQEAFSRAFKKRFAFSPLKFRKLQPDYSFLFGGQLMSSITRKSSDQKIPVEIKQFAPVTVAAVRYVGPYKDCEVAFTTLFEWATEQGLLTEPRQVIGISYDDPGTTPAQKLRYDACIEVSATQNTSGEINKLTIDGGRYACCIHKGSYQKLSETYVAVMGEWLPDSGEELRDQPPLEVFLNSPSETPEDELLTELRIPLK